MTLIITFLVAHIGAILSGLLALGGVAWGAWQTKSAATAKAQAQATVAQVAIGNAQAAQAGATAAANAAQAQADAAKVPDAGLDQAAAALGVLRGDGK